MQAHGDPILQCLIEKLGDNLQKTRVLAEDAIVAMCLHHAFGTRMCLSTITRPIKKQEGTNAKKTMNSNKQVIGKYNLLHRILSDPDC